MLNPHPNLMFLVRWARCTDSMRLLGKKCYTSLMARKNGKRTESDAPAIAVIYTRVSSLAQAADGLSLDAQIAGCRRYAAAHGWRLGETFTDVQSGKRDDRPRYQAMLAHVRELRRQGESVVVVTAFLHR